MIFRDIAYLITTTDSVTDTGDATETPTERQIYCNKKSIRQSEFWQAQGSGLRPELMLEIRSLEYNGEELIRYGTKTYTVIRTFDKGEFLELICQGLVS